MRIGVVIQKHPSRSIAHLSETVLAVDDLATVVEDTEPETKASWPTAARAWLAAREDATHVLFLEDDAVPCQHFAEAIVKAVEARPEHCVAFWANRAQVGWALAEGKSWVWCGAGFHGTVAVLLPAESVRPFVRWGDERYDPTIPGGHDQRLREWLAHYKSRVLLSAPCLVQHGAPEASLIWPGKGRMFGRPRVTPYFADDLGIDAREIDWRAGDG